MDYENSQSLNQKIERILARTLSRIQENMWAVLKCEEALFGEERMEVLHSLVTIRNCCRNACNTMNKLRRERLETEPFRTSEALDHWSLFETINGTGIVYFPFVCRYEFRTFDISKEYYERNMHFEELLNHLKRILRNKAGQQEEIPIPLYPAWQIYCNYSHEELEAGFGKQGAGTLCIKPLIDGTQLAFFNDNHNQEIRLQEMQNDDLPPGTYIEFGEKDLLMDMKTLLSNTPELTERIHLVQNEYRQMVQSSAQNERSVLYRQAQKLAAVMEAILRIGVSPENREGILVTEIHEKLCPLLLAFTFSATDVIDRLLCNAYAETLHADRTKRTEVEERDVRKIEIRLPPVPAIMNSHNTKKWTAHHKKLQEMEDAALRDIEESGQPIKGNHIDKKEVQFRFVYPYTRKPTYIPDTDNHFANPVFTKILLVCADDPSQLAVTLKTVQSKEIAQEFTEVFWGTSAKQEKN